MSLGVNSTFFDDSLLGLFADTNQRAVRMTNNVGTSGFWSMTGDTTIQAAAPSTSDAVMYFARANNQRSINLAGTINQNGADYAEYMTKSEGCGTIKAGDVCGIDENGMLTDVFDLAIKFCVKSTNPNLVGNDTWFNEQPPKDESEMPAFLERLEAARSKVDRIAFCGQVPVNCQFTAGDYLIPIKKNDGGIGIEVTKTPTFEQFTIKVGHAISDGLVIVSM